MIVAKDKSEWSTYSNTPEWAEENGYYLVEDGELFDRIIKNFPNFDFVLDGEGNLIDIKVVTESDRFEKLEADLAYVAMMADIDLESEDDDE